MTYLFRVLKLLGHQEWIRDGVKSRIINLFAHPDICHGQSFEADYFGLKYAGSLDNYIDWFVYFFGGYEKAALMLVKNLLKDRPEPVFIDVGMNLGGYSLFASTFCKEVHAFEPNKNVIDQAVRNINTNAVKNIFIHNIALGDETCIMELAVPKNTGNSGQASLAWKPGGALLCNLVKVDLVKGDDYFERLNLNKIDFIKIDVEGFEGRVLRGLVKTIRKYRPIIFMEFSDDIRESFPSVHDWASLFGGYNISEFIWQIPVLAVFKRKSYRLSPFDFSTSKGLKYIVCVPS